MTNILSVFKIFVMIFFTVYLSFFWIKRIGDILRAEPLFSEMGRYMYIHTYKHTNTQDSFSFRISALDYMRFLLTKIVVPFIKSIRGCDDRCLVTLSGDIACECRAKLN